MRKILLILFLALAAANAAAAEIPLTVPSDAGAQYFVLEKSGPNPERTIVTRRIGSSGTTYSRRLYNCNDNTVKYLGTGDSIVAMNNSRPDPKMTPIVEGSIAYYVGRYACR